MVPANTKKLIIKGKINAYSLKLKMIGKEKRVIKTMTETKENTESLICEPFLPNCNYSLEFSNMEVCFETSYDGIGWKKEYHSFYKLETKQTIFLLFNVYSFHKKHTKNVFGFLPRPIFYLLLHFLTQ